MFRDFGLSIRPLVVAATLSLACDPSSTASEPAAESGPDAGDQGASAGLRVALAGSKYLHAPPEASRDVPDAKASFEEIAALIEAHYVEGPLERDALWSGAIEGVMNRLIQVGDHRVNAVLSPEQYAELLGGTGGQIVGIGVQVSKIPGAISIDRVLPEGPAANAGLRDGDRILGVDGERIGDRGLAEVVHLIRGEVGSSVELFVQRDIDEWTQKVTRATIEVPSVQTEVLPTGEGWIHLRGLSKRAPEQLDAALAKLDEAGVSSWVLDLRDCPGGLFDSAVAIAERFLERGSLVVSLTDRKGERRSFKADHAKPRTREAMVILIGGGTASGGEIIAAALAHHGRASTVGEPTLGKSTVENVHRLANEWALKLSHQRFWGPDGEPAGVLTPEFPVAKPQRPAPGDTDAQLSTALGVLRLRAAD